jgi:hypothetical protein
MIGPLGEGEIARKILYLFGGSFSGDSGGF